MEKRSRMKIILFDPAQDLPIKTIKTILKQALNLYQAGVLKI
jgi:predicted RNA binding protein YcfA (HicA-like mRNA interferase family)